MTQPSDQELVLAAFEQHGKMSIQRLGTVLEGVLSDREISTALDRLHASGQIEIASVTPNFAWGNSYDLTAPEVEATTTTEEDPA